MNGPNRFNFLLHCLSTLSHQQCCGLINWFCTLELGSAQEVPCMRSGTDFVTRNASVVLNIRMASTVMVPFCTPETWCTVFCHLCLQVVTWGLTMQPKVHVCICFRRSHSKLKNRSTWRQQKLLPYSHLAGLAPLQKYGVTPPQQHQRLTGTHANWCNQGHLVKQRLPPLVVELATQADLELATIATHFLFSHICFWLVQTTLPAKNKLHLLYGLLSPAPYSPLALHLAKYAASHCVQLGTWEIGICKAASHLTSQVEGCVNEIIFAHF